MISVPETVLERIGVAWGERTADNTAFPKATVEATGISARRLAAPGTTLRTLARRAAKAALTDFPLGRVRAVVAATYSNGERFPSLAVRLAGDLSLPASVPAFDLQMACSAYPYALYAATHLARDLGGAVLVVDGDVQSPLVDPADGATAPLFSDAVAATVVTCDPAGESHYDFLTRESEALACPANGPVRMDGFAVFSFVATEVVRLLRPFGTDFDCFVPHQANAYMVRRLAKSLGLEDRLLTDFPSGNPGSASVPIALAQATGGSRALLAGFGAGFSAAAATVRLAKDFASCVDSGEQREVFE